MRVFPHTLTHPHTLLPSHSHPFTFSPSHPLTFTPSHPLTGTEHFYAGIPGESPDNTTPRHRPRHDQDGYGNGKRGGGGGGGGRNGGGVGSIYPTPSHRGAGLGLGLGSGPMLSPLSSSEGTGEGVGVGLGLGWLRGQTIVNAFNCCPDVASSVLICTSEVFRSPGEEVMWCISRYCGVDVLVVVVMLFLTLAVDLSLFIDTPLFPIIIPPFTLITQELSDLVERMWSSHYPLFSISVTHYPLFNTTLPVYPPVYPSVYPPVYPSVYPISVTITHCFHTTQEPSALVERMWSSSSQRTGCSRWTYGAVSDCDCWQKVSE